MERVKAVLAVGAVVFVVALVIFNATRPVEEEPEVWNGAFTQGSQETGKHFIMYTDLFCPHCSKFSNALHANRESFLADYIDNGRMFFEIRMTEMNHQTGHSNNSRPGGETAYCAARQGKFWEYYEEILDQLWEDYHSKGIGIDRYAEKIPDLELGYYWGPAERAGLAMDEFKGCVEGHETLEELQKNTTRASRHIESGVPYFVFGDYKASGFSQVWDTTENYGQAKLMFSAGGL